MLQQKMEASRRSHAAQLASIETESASLKQKLEASCAAAESSRRELQAAVGGQKLAELEIKRCTAEAEAAMVSNPSICIPPPFRLTTSQH